ncbi:2-dehydro-3-deoxygluconokinase [bioreactor metagenome]|jgi:2-dehydro-3-deoxygluconokinase|uniref:PfkB domain protein n=2 Tax=root TaxID=1 RepID=A0A652ZRU3_9SPIR|nr:sugar kinase [Treponema sp.]VBB38484.1 PfkB domain protein [uncultured Spirochaetota bacterium]
MSELKIPAKKAGGLDFLSLGALVTRLDPGIVPFGFADLYQVHVSGGEFNVAANLARCFGQNTAVTSAMVDYPIGAKIEGEVRKMGVQGIYKRFKHDGVRGPNMAQVWSDRGQGVRAPVVFYNRANEAAALLKPGDFDWDALFAKGIRWFHSGGIFAALSPTTPELVIEAMKAAKKAGAVVSFDLNYRAKLWAANGSGASACSVLGRIAEQVDVIVGNEEDLQMGLGLKGPDIHAASKLDPEAFYRTIEEVKERWPNVKAVATTLREVKSTNRHLWSAVLWLEGKRYAAPTAELDVYDRVGGGDGFATGLFYGLLEGKDPREALALGWAHGALLTTFPGDTTMATLDQVVAFSKGGSARIQR